jgi:hypothetical protein
MSFEQDFKRDEDETVMNMIRAPRMPNDLAEAIEGMTIL